MRVRFWNSGVYWWLLLGAVPVWLSLAYYFDNELDVTWFYYHLGSFVILAIIYPVLEEIVFRGFIQEQLFRILSQRRIGLVTLANILTSIIFSAMHLINHTPEWALLVFIPSLVFGFTKDRFDTLLAPVLLHVFYNMGYYLLFGAA